VSDNSPKIVPSGWSVEHQRFMRDDLDEPAVMPCFMFQNLPVHFENNEEEEEN